MLLIMLSGALIVALFCMRAVAAANAVIIDHLMPATAAAADLRLAVRRGDAYSKAVGMAQTGKEFDADLQLFNGDLKIAADAAEHARIFSDTELQRAALINFDKFWNGSSGWVAQIEHAFDVKRAGKTEQAQRILLDTHVDPVTAIVIQYTDETDRLRVAAVQRAAQLQQFAFTLSIGLGVVGGLISLVAVFATTRSMVSTVRQIDTSVEAVSVAAREIASGNNDLAQRTEEQAASLQQTAASMEELTTTVHQNTENSKEANKLAIGASSVAEQGGKVVNEVVATMSSIGASSKRIVDIISVIDGIAFQTNILALNAAVEAARAGEQGRGFAVVAAEVRNLAQRSSAAAKEINSLISDSVAKAEVGMKLADRAGTTMGEVVESVKRVTDIMKEISAASVEQGAGIEQVNQAVTQMDQVTQQNAALVEEMAAAASSLDLLATEVVESMVVFGVRNDDRTPPIARAQSSRRISEAGRQPAAPRAKNLKPAVATRRAPAARLAEGAPAGVAAEDWKSF